ncbi:MAG: glutamate decarboxylase [Acidimicrobiales bacterium]
MPLHHPTATPHGAGHRANPMHALDGPALGEELVLPTDRLGDRPIPAETAYQLVHDELMLDGNARLNLATFVTTWMEAPARRLMAECAEKNMIDKDEYPQTAELERRCVSILANLWHSPDPNRSIGCSTTGSSEACMLGGLALKRRWTRRRGVAGLSHARPNLVMGVNVQVCWEKFCNYWEVEPRTVPMEGNRFHLSAEEAVARCDENTIGVVAVLGSTFDGSYEPVAEISARLDDLRARTGLDIPIHVDGASGAMIAPFLDEELVWDFRLSRVASINTSGHKYGLVYPGVGWVLWRDHDSLPEELVFNVNYLGGNMPTFALNFSRPGAEVVAQYYTFLRLGFEGFRTVQQASRDIATGLAESIGRLGPFELITRGDELPVFAFTTRSDVSAYNVFDVARRLRERGWLVPAYTFPENRQDVSVLRVVVRNGFSSDLATLFLEDLGRLLPELNRQSGPLERPEKTSAFHH